MALTLTAGGDNSQSATTTDLTFAEAKGYVKTVAYTDTNRSGTQTRKISYY